MNSRIALTAALIGGAVGVALALRSERTRKVARRAYSTTTSATRARAAATAERLDVMIRDLESEKDEAAGGNQWRYQTLVSARDALVAVGHGTEDREPVGATASNGASAA
ncbi:MAG: hypothetical protein OEM67_12100 [Thermoleophilia bacterium]|nr:hypothetical protein [Thermoleophilia bacterium]MDH3725054.1 hypothetical protein [Thermoleophilia bacterium]